MIPLVIFKPVQFSFTFIKGIKSFLHYTVATKLWFKPTNDRLCIRIGGMALLSGPYTIFAKGYKSLRRNKRRQNVRKTRWEVYSVPNTMRWVDSPLMSGLQESVDPPIKEGDNFKSHLVTIPRGNSHSILDKKNRGHLALSASTASYQDLLNSVPIICPFHSVSLSPFLWLSLNFLILQHI